MSVRQPLKPPTIVDVAALAGVSKSTVSNVLRDTATVSEPTRRRVFDAIARLGYRPNAIARQFVQQRTTLLGVLVGDLDNPYYAEVAKLVERATFKHGYTAVFCNVEDDEEMAVAGVEALLEQRVAGVLFLAFFGAYPRIKDALAGRLPVVFVGLREEWGDSVAPQDAHGARLAVEHLIGLGHRRIGYVTTPAVEARTNRARYRGYRDALRRAQLEVLPPITWQAELSRDETRKDVLSVEETMSGPGRPTGLFVSNDMGAITLLDELERLGFRTPADVSVVGFDDISLARLRRISLTTVSQPLERLAEDGVELVIGRVEHPSDGKFVKRSVPVRLVARGSTGHPPALADA